MAALDDPPSPHSTLSSPVLPDVPAPVDMGPLAAAEAGASASSAAEPPSAIPIPAASTAATSSPPSSSSPSYHQIVERSSSRSRSPATRPLSSVQTLLRAAPQTAHLSLSSPGGDRNASGDEAVANALQGTGSGGGNSLRRPIDIVPRDTKRIDMPSPSVVDSPGAPVPLTEAALASQVSHSPTSPRTSTSRRRSSGIPLTSSASFSGAEGLNTRPLAFGATAGPNRAHVRASGKRPSTSGSQGSGVGSSRPHSPVQGGKGQTQSHHNSPSAGSRETFIGGQDQDGQPISPTDTGASRKTSSGELADFFRKREQDEAVTPFGERSELEAFEGLNTRSDSPSSSAYLPSLPSPEPRDDQRLPDDPPVKVVDKEHEQLRRNIEAGLPELSALSSAESSRRPSISGFHLRQRPASSSLPPGQSPTFDFRSSKDTAHNAEAWDWKSFIEAYADGRWDPYKVPNPPLKTPDSDDSQGGKTISSLGRLPLRTSSASAPSTSSSIAPPKPLTPPAASSVTASQSNPTLSLATGSLAASPAFTSPASPTQPSFTARRQGASPSDSLAFPRAKGGPPFMNNEEFAGLVRLAGAKSDLSPFVLPSPEHEHVDPLRDYASPSKEHPPSLAAAATKKAKGTGSSLLGTWTATSKGLLPSSGSLPPPSQSAHSGNNLRGPLDAIPATPFGESGPNSSGSINAPPFPMATAPLPVTESGRAAKKAASGEDYFGGPAQWKAAAAAAAEKDRWEASPESNSPPEADAETSPYDTVVSRRSSTWSLASDTGSTASSGSTRTVMARRASHMDGAFTNDPSFDNSSSPSTLPPPPSSESMLRRGTKPPGSLRHFPNNVLPKEAAANEAFRAFISQPFTPADLTNPSPPPPPPQRPPLASGKSDGNAAPARIPYTTSQSDGMPPRRLSTDVPITTSVPAAGVVRTSSHQERLFRERGWLSAPKPPDEFERRRALYRFNILRSGQDVNFDRIAHMAKLVFATRMVLISMVDDEDQWYKSESGLATNQGPREPSLCAHVILQQSPEPMIVLDTHQDWRFRNNPLVIGKPNIRFYAGAPLRTPDGYNIGSLCVFDDKPRSEFSPRQRHVLKEFAAICMRELELYRDRLHLTRRAMIQDSMERFTKEVVEMDTTTNMSLTVIYQQAASLIQKTLDVDGAFIMDLSAFELVEFVDDKGNATFRFQADQYMDVDDATRFQQDADLTPGTDARPVNFLERQNSCRAIPNLPVLGSSEHSAPPQERNRELSGPEHRKIGDWLKEYPNGKIYERIVPTWLRHMVPAGIQYAMICPVYSIDSSPFALVCAYTCTTTSQTQKQYLEGFELKYLRAIGLIILSAVLKRRLTLADKAKSQFISNISHELRTPLNGIILSGDLLADTKLDDQQTSFVQTVQACGTSLIETVNHVLDFTKLSGNTGRASGPGAEGTIQKTDVDLAQLIEETVEACWISQSARSLMSDSDIGSVYAPPTATVLRGENGQPVDRPLVECVVDIPYREDGWKMQVEKGGLRRVLMNLTSNAQKFTTDGYVLVTLRALPCADDAETVPLEIAVIDTGKGISKDFLQSQLFQPFSQENPLQTGTGLGLAIVNSIVSSDAVRGKVDVWSSEGLGTEIKVSLNAAPTRRRTSATESLASTDVGQGHSVSFLGFDERVRGLKLLRDVLEMNLTDWGFSVRPSTEPGWGDILMLNESDSTMDHFTEQGNVARPIIIFTTSRAAVEQVRAVNAYREAGGFATIVYKPAGPSKILAALRASVKSMGNNVRPSASSRRPSNLSSNGSLSPRPSIYGGSEYDVSSPRSSISRGSYSLEDDRNYFSAAHGSPSVAASHSAALHSFSPQHYLQRRRSEEERDPAKLRRPKRPSMGGRSITFQPDHASPLSFDGFSGGPPAVRNGSGSSASSGARGSASSASSTGHGGGLRLALATGEVTSDQQQQPSTPSSPGSTISLVGGGGLLLRSAVAPSAEVAAIQHAISSDQRADIPQVLVVEDNIINRRVLSAFLRKKGFNFIETCDGQQGVDMFESKPPGFFDVILMDLSMPVLDGLSATRAIRAIEAQRRTSGRSASLPLPSTPTDEERDALHVRAKLLALTGLATAEDKKKAFGSGVDGYLIKPVSLKTLDAVFKSFGYGI